MSRESVVEVHIFVGRETVFYEQMSEKHIRSHAFCHEIDFFSFQVVPRADVVAAAKVECAPSGDGDEPIVHAFVIEESRHV